MDCAVAPYSGVEQLLFRKTANCQFHQAVMDAVCPMCGVPLVRLLGQITHEELS